MFHIDSAELKFEGIKSTGLISISNASSNSVTKDKIDRESKSHYQ